MAKPVTLSASKLSIWLGDGASPEQFVAPCGLTTRGITFNAASNDSVIPDCDDPDLPAWIERNIASLEASVSGSGVLSVAAFPKWNDFMQGGVSINCRVVLDHAQLGYYEGLFILSQFEVTGEQGNKINVSVKLDSDGEIGWIDGAVPA